MQTEKANIKTLMASSSAGNQRFFEAGVDVIERIRIRKAISRYREKFLNKIFTPREIKSFPEEKELYYSIGFSLKEAFWKTLPAQVQKKTYFDDIEIIWKKGKPVIFVSGTVAKNFELSFFYSKKLVISCVIRYTKEFP